MAGTPVETVLRALHSDGVLAEEPPLELVERLHLSYRLLRRQQPPPGGDCLLLRREQQPSRWVPLADGMVVGRSEHADLVLDDTTLSARHLRFLRRDGDWLLEDLHSRNGTWVNGRRIQKHWLRAGDCIMAGSLLLLFAPAEDLAPPDSADHD